MLVLKRIEGPVPVEAVVVRHLFFNLRAGVPLGADSCGGWDNYFLNLAKAVDNGAPYAEPFGTYGAVAAPLCEAARELCRYWAMRYVDGGWSPARDQELNPDKELARAAYCYLGGRVYHTDSGRAVFEKKVKAGCAPKAFPWAAECWRPCEGSWGIYGRLADLVRGGELLLSEVARIDARGAGLKRGGETYAEMILRHIDEDGGGGHLDVFDARQMACLVIDAYVDGREPVDGVSCDRNLVEALSFVVHGIAAFWPHLLLG